MKFPGKANGAEAVRRLGNNIDKVGEWYGMTPERLAEILQKDHDAWLDPTGHLLFIDTETPPPEQAGAIDGSGNVLDPGPYPLTDTFKLHSKPGSQRFIYLDFNGQTVSGTAWNSGALIVAPPFDLDGIVSTDFSTAELSRIQYIWQRVAEDYAPFDVDVTTEEPTADQLNRASSSDQTYGTRAVITHSSIGVCTGCGGVAYVGVFDWYSSSNPTYYQPAWVLYDKLGPGGEKYVAEAISHEVGHNLGLSHDGTSTTGYYSGQGSGATGWAPIMGVGYYKELVQWSKGEYTDANNFEDDLQVIQSNGALLKPDDAGSSMGSAAGLAGAASSGVVTANQGGVIERTGDADYFSFASGSGPVQITVNPGLRSPNLDISLQLLDSAGVVLATSNPVDALNATLSTTLSAGGYYLKVEGVGAGDPLVTGYSNYASLGRYVISGTYTASTAQAPTAVPGALPTSGNAPLSVAFSSTNSTAAPGVDITRYTWNFGDGTAVSTSPNPQHTYTAPGTYTAVLTVQDSQGLTGSNSVPISVAQNPLATTLHIDYITLSTRTSRSGKTTSYQCVATVGVRNYAGGWVGGAKVSGAWSGVTTSGTVSANTSSAGTVSFTSAKTTSRGTCTFGVSGLVLSGWTYDAAQNLETTDSLTY